MKNRGKNLLLTQNGKQRLRAAVACLALFLPVAARGDPLQGSANQRSVLPGGRAALLGGAYTALSDDASGSFYNPAGLSFAKEKAFEISATGFRTTRTVYENTINGQPFEETSQEIYPSFIGGTTRYSILTIGYSFITLDSRTIYQRDIYEGLASAPGTTETYRRTSQESSSYIWAGGSLALKLGARWSLGVSGFYCQRDTRYTTAEQQTLNGGGFVNIDSTLKTLNTGMASVYGLTYRADSYSFGLSARLTKSLSNDTTLQQDLASFDPTAPNGDAAATPNATSSTTKMPSLNELNPSTYTLGAAWFPTSYFLFSGDVLVHEGVKSPYHAEGGYDLHTTWNYSVGTEFNFGSVSLLGSYFTNNSLYRAPDPGLTAQPAAVDFVGWSGGLGWNLVNVLGQIGMIRQQGHGHAQVKAGSRAIQEVRADIVTYVVSGKVPL